MNMNAGRVCARLLQSACLRAVELHRDWGANSANLGLLINYFTTLSVVSGGFYADTDNLMF